MGWICSIYWGYLIVIKSKGDHTEVTALLNKAQGQSDQQVQNEKQARKDRQRLNNPFDDAAYIDTN